MIKVSVRVKSVEAYTQPERKPRLRDTTEGKISRLLLLRHTHIHTNTHRLTQLRDGVGIDVTGQLNRSLEDSVWDPAVGQPEALSLASLTGELPEDLHSAGVHHLREERGRGRHWTESGDRKSRVRRDELTKKTKTVLQGDDEKRNFTIE